MVNRREVDTVDGELMPYVRGELKPRGQDRELVARGRSTYEKVQLSVLKERGGFALAGDIGEGVTALHKQFKQLAGDDLGLALQLADIQQEATNGARHVMQRYYSDFGF